MGKIKQAFDYWKFEILPMVKVQYGSNDTAAISESWNDYSDSELSGLLCHYCPAFDEEIPECDAEFLLQRIGASLEYRRIISRPDAAADNWGKDARHYEVWFCRADREPVHVYYSQGHAYRNDPELADVAYCLISELPAREMSFKEWCAEFGRDSDSRKQEIIYNECRKNAAAFAALFSDEEMQALSEVFEDY